MLTELSDDVDKRSGLEPSTGGSDQFTFVSPASCPIRRASRVTLYRKDLMDQLSLATTGTGRG